MPQGDPGELDAAARQAGLTGRALESDADTVRHAVATAAAAWTGAAQSAFGAYAAGLIAVFDSNSGALSQVSGVLSGLASELESAQKTTTRAQQQCTHYQGVVDTQTQAQQEYTHNANQLSMHASLAPHPVARADYSKQAEAQQQLADEAGNRITQANGELEYWKRQGANAYSTYPQHAQDAARKISSLEDELKDPKQLQNAPIPIPVTAADVKALKAKLPEISKIPASAWEHDPKKALQQLTGGKGISPAEALLLSQIIAGEQARANQHHSGGGGFLGDIEAPFKWGYDHVVKPGINDLASIANAFINDPSDALDTIAGALTATLGAGMEGGGGLLDATGIGAPVGVALNVAGAGTIAAGGALATKGAVGLGSYAAQHPVQVLHASSNNPSKQIGASREQEVAQLTGGKVAGEPGEEGLPIQEPGVGSTDVDVIGPNGEYIAVGGPAKAAKLAQLGKSLRVLKYAADQAGVRAQAYFVEGTPQSVLDLARRWLGADNVFTFPGS